MKKSLFVIFLFLFQVNHLFAQNAPNIAKHEFIEADSLSFSKSDEKAFVSGQAMNEIIINQIERYKINSQGDANTFIKRKGKARRKSKFGFLYLNFAEHVFRTFTC